MKSVAEARAEILSAFAPLGEEELGLLAAQGRFLVAPVHAGKDLPPFDSSAMDGYALRAQDVAKANEAIVELLARGESRAGGEAPEPLASGSAMRIFTGAPLPAQADAVQLQEKVERSADLARFREPVMPHANVRLRGSDVALGELALSAHSEIGPGEIALLASLEHASVRVFRRPRVAIVCTGDELRELGEPNRPGSIVNSNAYALSAQVTAAGAVPVMVPKARDTRTDVARAVRDALQHDVVVLSGGVSVGEYDVVRDGLADAGVTLSFWSVCMKPGKPVSFARHGTIPVLGLPGNPVSAWVTFELFVRPGLRKMLGDPRPERPRVDVVLDSAMRRTPGRTEFARARLSRRGGQLLAQPLARQSSGALSSMVDVDALLEVPAAEARGSAREQDDQARGSAREQDDQARELPAGTVLNALLLRALPG